MRKIKILSILAVSAIFGCFGTLNHAFTKTSAAVGSTTELCPFGDAEKGAYTDGQGRVFTPTNDCSFEGQNSFLFPTETQVRVNGLPVTDGTVYKGSFRAYNPTGGTIQVIGVVVNSNEGQWPTAYLDMYPAQNLTGDWDLYEFKFAMYQTADHLELYRTGDLEETPTTNPGTLAALEFVFRCGGGATDVYIDNWSIDKYVPEDASNLTPWGDAEHGEYTDINTNKMTPTGAESYRGFSSFKVGQGQIRANMAKIDGTRYEGSMKVLGTSGEKFHLVGTITYQNMSDGWSYTYLDMFPTIDCDGTWQDYEFTFKLDYAPASKILDVYRTDTEDFISVQDVKTVAALDWNWRAGASEAYVDDIRIVEEYVEPEPPEDYSKATLYYDFENGINGFAGDGTGATPISVSTQEEAGVAHSGEKAMKFSGIWAREWHTPTSTYLDIVQSGKFFKVSAFVKNVGESATSAIGEFYIWGCDENEENWVMVNKRIRYLGAVPLNPEMADFSKISNVFGLYSDGEKGYFYNGGNLEELSDLAGKYIAPQFTLDLGNASGGTVIWDDLAFIPTTVSRDAVITVSGADDVDMVVYKGEEPIRKQPEVTHEGNVYTLADMSFEAFDDTYTVSVEKEGQVLGEVDVSYINNEVAFSAVAYDAHITVKDVDNQPIKTAKLTYADQEVTENVNGVYTIPELKGNVKVTIKAEGYVSKEVTVTPEVSDVSVNLLDLIPAPEYVDNLSPQGSFENGWTPFQMEGGVSGAITGEQQRTGEKGYKLKCTQANGRLMTRPDAVQGADGTPYHVEFWARSDEPATLTLQSMATCVDQEGGWAYNTDVSEPIEITSEWTLIEMEFSIWFDEAHNTLYSTINGSELHEMTTPIASVAAWDLCFKIADAGSIIYIDDFAIFEIYDAQVKVLDENGNPCSEVTFLVTDHLEYTQVGNPEYDAETGKFLFEDLFGAYRIIAQVGEKTYDPVVVTKQLKDITIEESFAITVTLKDTSGNAIKGAKIVARKGIVDVGTFTDNNDGTYKLEGVMGTVTLVITKDGYTFDKVTGVNASNCNITAVGTPDSPTPGPTPTPEKKGCGGSIVAVSSLVSVLAIAGFAIVAKKKHE